MNVVYKYKIPIPCGKPGTLVELDLPVEAQVLKIGSQPGPAFCGGERISPNPEFFLWARVDPDEERKETRKILVVGTGHKWEDVFSHPKFNVQLQETVIALGGSLVFHFWVSTPVGA